MIPSKIQYKEPIKQLFLPENRWYLGLEYQIGREIGHGTYGKVYEALETLTNKKVAIKKFVRALGHAKLAQYCLREIEIMSKLTHPNIVKKSKIVPVADSVCIVMDYMPFDLKKLISSDTYLDHIQVKKIMYEIMISLNYLHSSKIVHRDIKPGNILASLDCKIKLCDFGFARSICGLKISAYDFDEIYRKEFSVSDEGIADSGVAGGTANDEEIPNELDEVMKIQPIFTLPMTFVASRKNLISQEHSFSPLHKKPSKKNPVYRVVSVEVKHSKISATNEEVKKTNSVKEPEKNVSVRRTQFIKSIKKDPWMKRELTSHIATRWYRAPEVILLEKVYCSSVDIWGIGCVFGELLQMIKGNVPLHTDRKPLFPGTSCFPLSPLLKPCGEGKSEQFQDGDQLVKICQVLGTPTEEDASFISEFSTKECFKLIPKYTGVDWNGIYPDCTAEEIDLLKKMLTFNPYLRITAKEALRHPYFLDVRHKEKELEGEPITLVNEQPDVHSVKALTELCEKEKHPRLL